MTDRFQPGRLGDWVIKCDICGQKCFASESFKLPTNTGRGGLVVCAKDADKVDYGLVPFTTPVEQNVPWTRVNHLDTSTENLIFDLDVIPVESIDTYVFLGISQGENNILATSQDADVLFIT